MANEQNLRSWQPGQSGNPAGYSRGRRIADTVIRLIEEKGLNDEIGLVILAKSLGHPEFLEYTDAAGKKRRRKPDLRWFGVLLEQIGQAEAGGGGPDGGDTKQVVIPDADDRHAPDRPET